MWPGVVGVDRLKPEYEIHAWLGLAGSTEIPETNRCGSLAASESIRVNEAAAALTASAFLDTKTRPVLVAAHSVDVSLVARSVAAIVPPARSPNAALISCVVAAGPPSGSQ